MKKNEVKIGKRVSVDKLTLLPRHGPRSSKFDSMLAEVARFKKSGDSVPVSLPHDTPIKVFQNLLGSVLRRKPPAMAKGLTYIKRSIVDGKTGRVTGVAIIAVKDKGKKVRHGGRKKAKAKARTSAKKRTPALRKTRIKKKHQVRMKRSSRRGKVAVPKATRAPSGVLMALCPASAA